MEGSNKHLIPLAIVVAGVMIAGAIYFGGKTTTVNTSLTGDANQAAAVTLDVAPVTSQDHIQGPAAAKVIVIEYSDTECPFCKLFHSTMEQVMQNYKGQSVAWVYRHFPIAALHSKAPKEAEATECAAEQGGNDAFWAFIDEVFSTTNSNDSLDPSQLPKIAADVGLDVTKFNNCLSSGKYTNFINQSVQAAVKAGAQGTPYSVIISGNKKVIVAGAQPYDYVKQQIDALLK